MERQYASLHNHSEFSNLRLIDSINRYSRSIDYCWDLGLTGIAMTEHECLSGSLVFLDAYRKKLEKEWKAVKGDEPLPSYAELARRFDFKAILGNEIYLTQEGCRPDKPGYFVKEKANLLGMKYSSPDTNFYHYILLAKDMEGLKQLRRISSAAWERSFVYKGLQRVPTYPSDLIKEIQGGHVICSTACLGGYPAKQFLKVKNYEDGLNRGDPDFLLDSESEVREALASIDTHLAAMEKLFGKGNYYIELQPNDEGSEQNAYNEYMIRKYWGKYPFIFTTDSHYLNADERTIHKDFLQSKSSKEREVDDFYKYAYFMSQEEVRSLMPYLTDDMFNEMVQNTQRIADMCQYYEFERPPVIPVVDYEYWSEYEPDLDFLSDVYEEDYPIFYHHIHNPKADISERYLARLIAHGLVEKADSISDYSVYYKRIEEELTTISEVGKSLNQKMENYFITIAKLVELMWNAGSLVGPARGSAGASLILYLLGVIQIDPIKLDLPFFWRFMHPSRPDMADVDIDTETNKRQAVFNTSREYFVNRGGEMVNVCTFGTEGTKSALKTAARGLNIPVDMVSYVTSMIPNERGFDWSLNDCYNGNGDDRKPIAAFRRAMDDNPRWWQLAQNIEGLITRLGVHASGVVCIDGDVNEYCSLMKTKNGQLVTSFELHNADRVGLIKYDYLTVSALDRIHQCMNYMLENGRMEWQGDLKSTYLKYLDPSKLDYSTEKMWDMAADGKIRSLFQFDTVVGGQSIAKIRPKSLKQLAISNSVMRLMSDGDEQPLDIYVKQKAVPEIWYDKMRNAGLTMQEIKILEKYLKEKSGVADSQEVLMQLSMDPGISNFSMKDANALRKTIAKKKFDQIEAIHNKFNEQGLAALNRQKFLDFVWKDCVELQLGYSFSTVHTTAYSIVAVQEMNLAYHLPIIYWNCACLSIDSSAVSDEDFYNLVDEDIIELDDNENKKVQNKMDYSKIATALDSFKRDGIKIRLPLVNESRLSFTPNEKDNEILYGLKGITKVTDPAIEQIMMNRPFKSFDEFLSRVTKKVVSKDKIINLIKCGGFDDICPDKRELMKQYLTLTSEPKKNLTLQNANMLIDLNILPPELEFEGDVYKLTKELRKHRDENKMWYAVDELEIPNDKFEKWQEIVRDSNVPAVSMLFNGSPRQVIDSSKWDRYYDSQMEHIRNAIKKDKDVLLARLNQKLFENEWNKYASGDNLQWELDSINFYFSGHPLDNVLQDLPVAVDRLEDIVEDAQDGEFYIKGKVIPKMKLYTIAGTVIDKNTTKSTITVQTPDGVVVVKIYKNLFSTLGATLSSDTESGEKLIEQEGFFEKGTHLLITGIKRGSTFVPKVYKSTGRNSVLKINLDENGRFLNLEEKQDVE